MFITQTSRLWKFRHFSSGIQKASGRYQVSGILKKCSACKELGFSVVMLIQYLFCLAFFNRSMFPDVQWEKALEFRKDTIRRLKSSAEGIYYPERGCLCASGRFAGRLARRYTAVPRFRGGIGHLCA